MRRCRLGQRCKGTRSVDRVGSLDLGNRELRLVLMDGGIDQWMIGGRAFVQHDLARRALLPPRLVGALELYRG